MQAPGAEDTWSHWTLGTVLVVSDLACYFVESMPKPKSNSLTNVCLMLGFTDHIYSSHLGKISLCNVCS